MKNVASSRRNRKKSNVVAAGVTSHGDPGARDGSPRGSNVRPTSYLTLTEEDRLWCVVRVDVTSGLGLEERTVLVVCNDLRDAAQELAAWSHGLDLPYRDFHPGAGTNIPGAAINRDDSNGAGTFCDPAYGWPIS